MTHHAPRATPNCEKSVFNLDHPGHPQPSITFTQKDRQPDVLVTRKDRHLQYARKLWQASQNQRSILSKFLALNGSDYFLNQEQNLSTSRRLSCVSLALMILDAARIHNKND